MDKKYSCIDCQHFRLAKEEELLSKDDQIGICTFLLFEEWKIDPMDDINIENVFFTHRGDCVGFALDLPDCIQTWKKKLEDKSRHGHKALKPKDLHNKIKMIFRPQTT